MIAKHSHEQSQKGEGVEVIENRPHEVIFINIYLEQKCSQDKFLNLNDRTLSMAQANSQRREYILAPNCHTGSKRWSQKYFMSQKKPGTTTRSQ